MRRLILLTTILLLTISAIAKPVTSAASLPAYYKDIDGKSGKTLFDAVHAVAKVGYSSLGYDGLWSAYQYTDLRDNGYVWDMYSDCTWKSLSSNRCGNYSDECDCYNREHSIPKSWYGGKTSGPGCDIFHLVPTDGKVNGMRSSYAYGEVGSADYNKHGNKLGTAKSITITNGNTIAGNEGASVSCSGTVFEPRNEYKGDFARGYFGTMIKWANGDYTAFTSGDGSKMFSSNYNTGSFGLTKYGVALLMKWHRQDPVSQKEIDRNNGIQQTQGNRNPFIDYPYLAEYIWGEKAGETLDLSKLITAYDERFELGKSDGWLGDSAPVETYTVKWLVSGEEYMTGDPTVQLNKGGVITKLPSAPKSCDEVSTQFVGWSEEPIIGTTDEQPIDLFTTADDAPDIMQNTEFHAVFAKLTEVVTYSSHAPAAESTVSMSLTDQAGWTLSGLKKDSKHWRMVSGSYIESPSVDASQITSITINMRTYGGDTYNTIDFSINNKEFGELKATTNSLKDYTWKPSGTLSGTGKIRFSSTTNTAKNGPALSKIAIQLSSVSSGDTGGGEDSGNTGGDTGGEVSYVYTRYMTTCQGTSTEHVELTPLVKEANKILNDGQLLIEYNGVYYNILGHPLNF
jgi:endonuclease I